ncbi:MAG: MotA/TolQ/ExbB proton channel family protein [Spirochaetales bacterium]|nr:MotA/TolQ/ExbB proton channel family protein [Spirochaetales bacterium]
MIEMFKQGGPVMIPIMLAFLIAIIIIIERLLYLNGITKDEVSSLKKINGAVRVGKIQEALKICDESGSPACNIMKAGIINRDRPEPAIKEAILTAASLEIPKLERFLTTLGTIAHIAPLLGLLGTVTGNIKAFDVLGEFGAGADPKELAKGIAEALLTTAAGIIVAVPTLIFYNYLVAKVNHMILRLENKVNDVVVMLKGKPAAPRQGA